MKQVLEVLIQFNKKGLKVGVIRGRMKSENKFPPLQFH